MKLFPYVVDKATTISGRLLLPCTSTIEQSAPVFSLGLAMLWSMGQEQLWYKQSWKVLVYQGLLSFDALGEFCNLQHVNKPGRYVAQSLPS